MIAVKDFTVPQPAASSWQDTFVAMLPKIRQFVQFAFRNLHEDAQDEAVSEAVANAMVAYVRLVERGKADLAYPTVLARFAVAQFKSGRRVGNRQRAKDVLAGAGRRNSRFVVEGLRRFDEHSGEWIDATIDDGATPVPDQAAFRCDFPVWLGSHSSRKRQIAEALSLGNTTQEVAERFNVSSARISQLRNELHASWQAFHGETSDDAAVSEAP